MVYVSCAGGVHAATPKKAAGPPSADDLRRKQMETELRSGNADQVQKAFDDLKQWFADKPYEAENSFWRLRGDFVTQVGHEQDLMDALDSAELAKKADPNKKHRESVGYLYVLRGCCLFRQGKKDEGLAQIQRGLAIDQVGAGAEAVNQLPKVLMADKRYQDLSDLMLQVILAAPDDPKVVEPALKQRISTFNVQSKYADAIADAKRLFNIATMEHTADALTILDRQLALSNIEDRTTVSKFRQEETDGANPPGDGEAAHTSSVVLGIKVDSASYDSAIQSQVDGSFAAIQRHTALLLIADHPADALVLAKRAYAQAANAKEIAAATDMIARCFKAQDGTIGRANAWIAGPSSGGQNVASQDSANITH